MNLIKSYRIFTGKGSIKCAVIAASANVLANVILGMINKNVINESFNNFVDGVIPVISAFLLSFTGGMSVLGIFATNAPEKLAGFKYYHSLPNSARHFQNALILGNIITFIATAVYMIPAILLFDLAMVCYVVCFILLAMGFLNFFGLFNKRWGYVVSFMILGFAMGFGGSYFEKSEIPVAVIPFIVIGTSVIYLFGTLFAIFRSKSVWEKEREK